MRVYLVAIPEAQRREAMPKKVTTKPQWNPASHPISIRIARAGEAPD